MNTEQRDALDKIRNLFNSQKLMVLSTCNNDKPYTSLLAFAASEDVSRLVFLTPKTTRKYENLTANSQVSLLVDNAENRAGDVYDAIALTAVGNAQTITGADKDELLSIYLERHPHLRTFSEAKTTALVCVSVSQYFLVSRFQNVIELRMTP